MQKAIDAADSDMCGVLAYVAFASARLKRATRAEEARTASTGLTDKQREFVAFVLGQYIKQGVYELDVEKLPTLLKLKYRSALADAFAELGKPEQVRGLFTRFQRHLY